MLETQRYEILRALGLKKGDVATLWPLLDTVEQNPALEESVLSVLDEFSDIRNQRFLLGTEQSGLKRAKDVEFDPASMCRASGEVKSEWVRELGDLIGWEFETVTVDNNLWF